MLKAQHHITGCPLLNSKIEKFLLGICEEYNLRFTASIIPTYMIDKIIMFVIPISNDNPDMLMFIRIKCLIIPPVDEMMGEIREFQPCS